MFPSFKTVIIKPPQRSVFLIVPSLPAQNAECFRSCRLKWLSATTSFIRISGCDRSENIWFGNKPLKSALQIF